MIKTIIDRYVEQKIDVELNFHKNGYKFGGFYIKNITFAEYYGCQMTAEVLYDSEGFVAERNDLDAMNKLFCPYVPSHMAEIANDIRKSSGISESVINSNYIHNGRLDEESANRHLIHKFIVWLADISLAKIESQQADNFTFALLPRCGTMQKDLIVIYEGAFSEDIKKAVIERTGDFSFLSKIFTLNENNDKCVKFMDEREGIHFNSYWAADNYSKHLQNYYR